jgi:hypothetical protein
MLCQGDKFFFPVSEWSISKRNETPALYSIAATDAVKTKQNIHKTHSAGGRSLEKGQWMLMDMRLQIIEKGGAKNMSRPIRARPVLLSAVSTTAPTSQRSSVPELGEHE